MSVAAPLDLKSRVENRKRSLISEIIENKMNSSRPGAAEAIDRARVRLSELARIVKEDATDGWTNVGPRATMRFDKWMAR